MELGGTNPTLCRPFLRNLCSSGGNPGQRGLIAEAFGFFGKFGSSKFAGDYKPPDLARARPYFIELGIPPKLLDREFKAVPITAMDLDGLITNPGC